MAVYVLPPGNTFVTNCTSADPVGSILCLETLSNSCVTFMLPSVVNGNSGDRSVRKEKLIRMLQCFSLEDEGLLMTTIQV